MLLIALSLSILSFGGALPLLAGGRGNRASVVGASSIVLGCLIGLVPVWRVITTGVGVSSETIAWHVPYGSIVLELSPVSAWFALPILLVSGLAAIYGCGYMRAYSGSKALGIHWFFFSLLVASIFLVVLARNGVLFLVSWEFMSLTSFFLVTFDDENETVRHAGRTYLIATHLGTACLLAMFALLGVHAGSMDFADIAASAPYPSAITNLAFVLGVVGFGTKAGIFPLHIWLPETYPAAPSHVSAVMSGVMSKSGIYGIIMILSFLGSPPVWWGWLLIGAGAVSGFFGVISALAQNELKRMLAYSSIENIGIITMALGLGILGQSLDRPGMASLGIAAALLHMLNHAMFKGLLFLCAGAIFHRAHTTNMSLLGGLQRKMPIVAAAFLVGAISISALPPLNGFVSEFLIYFLALHESVLSPTGGATAGLVVLGSLALIGGLVVACFVRAYGIVFLGTPRSELESRVHEPGVLQTFPLTALAGACALIGLGSPVLLRRMAPIIEHVTGYSATLVRDQLDIAIGSLSEVVIVAVGIIALFGIVAVVRVQLLRRREVGMGVTWDCGYAEPTARMQYTSSSFAQPTSQFFAPLLRTRQVLKPLVGLFPSDGSFGLETPDTAMEHGYRPLLMVLHRIILMLHWIQQGRLNYYVMYIALTIVALLIWLVWASK